MIGRLPGFTHQSIARPLPAGQWKPPACSAQAGGFAVAGNMAGVRPAILSPFISAVLVCVVWPTAKASVPALAVWRSPVAHLRPRQLSNSC
jgi:hypothetical protein